MVYEKASLDRVVEEHRELRHMLRELHAFLETPQPPIVADDSHIWAGDLAERLVRLHHKLFLHFREEDRAGVLDDLADRFPRAMRTLQTLKAEHHRLLAEIRETVAATLMWVEDKLPGEFDLQRRAQRLAKALVRHEEAETDLIQRLYWEDLGGGN